jgi:hypothetical protein
MPARKASPIELSFEHERELTALVRAHSTPQKLMWTAPEVEAAFVRPRASDERR